LGNHLLAGTFCPAGSGRQIVWISDTNCGIGAASVHRERADIPVNQA
jgi:hypothetical protein